MKNFISLFRNSPTFSVEWSLFRISPSLWVGITDLSVTLEAFISEFGETNNMMPKITKPKPNTNVVISILYPPSMRFVD